jgi:hypothetical protein
MEEGVGWASEGFSAEEAAITLAKLKKAASLGEGPTRLTEQREQERIKKEKEEAQRARSEKEKITVDQFFEATYLPRRRKTGRKAPQGKKDSTATGFLRPLASFHW